MPLKYACGSVFVSAFALIISFLSCSPKIYSFVVEPAAISAVDSVHLTWSVRGKPTMMFNQVRMAVPGADSLQLLEFTLYVEKGSKNPAHLKKQVMLLPESIRMPLYVRVDSFSDDHLSLIAIGLSDTVKWRGIYIVSVINPYDRDLRITHAGITKELKKTSVDITGWKNLPFGGLWEIKSALSEAEKKDHSLVPTRIAMQVIIRPGKNQ